MLRDLRKNVASRTAPVVPPEIFPWTRWIKQPHLIEEKVPALNYEHYDTADIILELIDAFVNEYKFSIDASKETKTFDGSFIESSKSNRIFFGFGTTKSKNIKGINYPEYRLKNLNVFSFDVTDSPVLISGKIYLPKIIEIAFKPEPRVNEKYNFNIFITPILTIDFINTNLSVSEDLLKYKSSNNSSEETVRYDYELKLAEIINHTFSVLPEIHNYKLLDEFKYSDDMMFFTSVLWNWKISTAAVLRKLNLLTPSDYIAKTYFLKKIHLERDIKIINPDYEFHTVNTFSFKFGTDKPAVEIFYLNDSSGIIEDFGSRKNDFSIFDSILSPYLSPSFIETSTTLLPEYQKAGIEFLSGNKFAFLNDEFGLGKYIQTIRSLKKVIENNKLRNLLIVTDKEEIGFYENSRSKNTASGWLNQIFDDLPGMEVNVISGNLEERSKLWQAKEQINICSYAELFEDVNTGIIEKEFFKRFELVVLDNCEQLMQKELDFKQIHEFLTPKFIWLLSGIKPEFCKQEIYTIFANDIFRCKSKTNYLRRTRKETNNTQKRKTNYINYWIDLDSQQELEYDQTLNESFESLIELQKNGNPYRFEANVFSAIHRLMQISNCASSSRKSNKLDLLVKQLKNFSKNSEQCIVLTQYEKQGLDVIENGLENCGLKYVKITSGMSANLINQALTKFKQNSSSTVLLCSLKRQLKQIEFPKVPYLIHFDKWWNPAVFWQNENNFLPVSNSDMTFRTVYSYYSKDTIEKDIENLLHYKGLLNKSIFENLPAQSFNELIDDVEWIDLFKKNIEMRNQKSESETMPRRAEMITETKDIISDLTKKFFMLAAEDKMEKVKRLLKLLNYRFEQIIVEDENLSFGAAVNEIGTRVKSAAVIMINTYQFSNLFDEDIYSSINNEYDEVLVFLLSPGLNNVVQGIKCDHSLIDPLALIKLLNQFRLL